MVTELKKGVYWVGVVDWVLVEPMLGRSGTSPNTPLVALAWKVMSTAATPLRDPADRRGRA